MATYLFIDGGYLRRNYTDSVRSWFREAGEIDFRAVKGGLAQAGRGGIERCFYYDALEDEQREGETEEDFKLRISQDEMFFNKIEELAGYFVRLGSLTGHRNRRQKKVDILLAVEALDHAVRRNMDRAILLTGDRDFEPLVHSLVQLGVRVEVAGDRKTTSKYLRRAADVYRLLSFADYYHWTIDSLRARFPMSVRSVGDNLDHAAVFEHGTFQGKNVTLSKMGAHKVFYMQVELFHNDKNHLTLQSDDAERLKLYFELQYGKVDWKN